MTENPYPHNQPAYNQPAYNQPASSLGPMPGANDTPRESVAVPPEVQKAWTLWMVSIALGVVGTVVGLLLVDRNAAINKIIEDGTTMTGDEVSTTVTVSLIVGAVFALIIIGLELFFVFKMRAGRNWARIVLTVLGALSVLSGGYGLATSFNLGSVLTLISIVVVLAAIVFMYRPTASAYFQPGRR